MYFRVHAAFRNAVESPNRAERQVQVWEGEILYKEDDALSWLSKLDCESLQETYFEKLQVDVLSPFFEREEYTTWVNKEHRFLWCTGKGTLSLSFVYKFLISL